MATTSPSRPIRTAPPPRPDELPYPTEPAQLPALFRPLSQFVAWRPELRDGRWTKVLIDPHTGRRARANDPRTWDTFAGAVACARRVPRLSGISIVLTEDLGVVGGDLDHCRDPQTGRLAPWADEIRRRMDTPPGSAPPAPGCAGSSGPASRKLVVATLHGKKTGRRDTARGIEVYRSGRHLTLTTVRVPGTPGGDPGPAG